MFGHYWADLGGWTTVGWPVVVQLALDATIVLGAAALACLAMRRASAALRHGVWTVAIAGLLALPLLRAALPGVPLGRLIPIERAAEEGEALAEVAGPTVTADLEPVPETWAGGLSGDSMELPVLDAPSPDWTADAGRLPVVPMGPAPQADGPSVEPAAAVVPAAEPEAPRPGLLERFWTLLPWPTVLVGIWGAGAVWGLLNFLAALGCTQWFLRRAVPVDDPRWQALLAEMSGRLGIRRSVELVESDRTTVPSTAGWSRPRIILPSDHGEWSEEIRRVVLAHELTHVARRDVLWQMIARAVAVFYWFHPLVHLASRRLRWEREVACDDAVLRLGERPSSYAKHLLGFAATLAGRSPLFSAAVALATRRPIETRIRRVLHPSLSRAPLSVRAGCVLVGVTSLVLLLVGVIRAIDAPPQEMAEPAAVTEVTEDPGESTETTADHADTVATVAEETGTSQESSEEESGPPLRSGPGTRAQEMAEPAAVEAEAATEDEAGESTEASPDHADTVATVAEETDASQESGEKESGAPLRSAPVTQGSGAEAASDTKTTSDKENASSPKAKSNPDAAKKFKKASGPSKSVTLSMVDEQGKPVPGASVVLQIRGRKTRRLKADESGKLTCEVPLDQWFSLRLGAKGRASMYGVWEPGRDTPADAYTVTLGEATTIGGTVRDDEGRPIKGARINISTGLPIRREMYFGGWLRRKATTDADGQWRITGAPKDPEWSYWHLQIQHDDFMVPRHGNYRPQPTTKSLLDHSSVMVLKKGLAVEGTVTDAQGQPIAGAMVGLGDGRMMFVQTKKKTDKQGHYRFGHCKAGPLVMTAVAAGHAPLMREVKVSETMGPVDFALAPGKTMRLRVVDKDGKPIAGAGVGADTWRDCRTLYGMGMPTKTDAHGRWVWDGAPDDEVQYDVFHKGYMRQSNLPLVAADQEQTIVLAPKLVISGQVIDEKSGKPIKTFRVLPGQEWDRGDSSWQSWERGYRATTSKDGRYTIALDMPVKKRLIRIEAPGYGAAISRIIGNDEGNVTLDFELEPDKGFSGTVVGPDDKPVAGADVLLCTPSQGAYLKNGRILDSQRNVPSAKTDANGRFTLPATEELFLLSVLADEGWAEVSQLEFRASPTIHLASWARVEGIVRIGSKPGAGADVSLDYDNFDRSIVTEYGKVVRNGPGAYHEYRAQADQKGHFVFERARPDLAFVSRTLTFGETDHGGRSTSAHPVLIDLQPGETTHVTLGGTGRPVAGRIVLSDAVAERVDFGFTYGSLRRRVEVELPPLPSDTQGMTPLELQTIVLRARRDRSMVQRAQYQSYSFVANRDGTFRCDDVPPGEYELYVYLEEAPKPGDHRADTSVGRITRKITVPEFEGERSDEPFDVGELSFGLPETTEAENSAAKPATTVRKAEPSGKSKDRRRIKLHVVDEHGKPVEGATASVKVYAEEMPALAAEPTVTSRGNTDKHGNVSVEVGGRASGIVVRAPGRVTMRAEWKPGNVLDRQINDRLTVVMSPGATIGGVVRDEQGKPVGGATVIIGFTGEYHDGAPLRFMQWDYKTVTADDEGRWRFDRAPEKLDNLNSLLVQANHAGYARNFCLFAAGASRSSHTLRTGSFVSTLEKGHVLEGTVTASDGQPVAGARVFLGLLDHLLDSKSCATKTDQAGRFRFVDCAAGTTLLTVLAPSLAPALDHVNVGSAQEPVAVRLAPAKTLRVRVVDPAGKPVAGAAIMPMLQPGMPTFSHILGSPKTDAQGRWVWRDAPRDAFDCMISKQGYERHDVAEADRGPYFKLHPGDDEQTIVLRRVDAARATGRVVDARTGKPITGARVMKGTRYVSPQGETISWLRHGETATTDSDGRFSIALDGPFLRVEASGYRPATTQELDPAASAKPIVFELEPAENLAGVVADADGKPVAGAEVFLVRAEPTGLTLQNGRPAFPAQAGASSTKTDEHGRFEFPPVDKPYLLMVLDDSGYAEIWQSEFGPATPIRLTRWARVEGIVKRGARPAAGVPVELRLRPLEGIPGRPNVTHYYRVETDAAGRFVIDRALAEEGWLYRDAWGRANPLAPKPPLLSHKQAIELRPGQTTKVELGGDGRPVVGRLVLPPEAASIVDFGMTRGTIKEPFDPRSPLEGPRLGLSPAEQAKDSRERAQLWRDHELLDPVTYHFTIGSDGRFRCEDVPPGEYRLRIQLYVGGGMMPGQSEEADTIEQLIKVPEVPAGQSSGEVVDLGNVGLLPDDVSGDAKAPAQSPVVKKSDDKMSSSEAVSRAVKWLAEHQLPDGGWSLDLTQCPSCQGKCSDSGRSTFSSTRNAATGLALLAMLGEGNTHTRGDHQESVRAGLDFLMASQDAKTGSLFEKQGRMYSHGIASLALCEAYGMTADEKLRGAAQKSIDFIVFAQDPKGGGWRYVPKQPGDTSVFGWQMLAIHSARQSGLSVPNEVIEKANRFLDQVQFESGSRYGYISGSGGSEATTAIGLLGRMHLGWDDQAALERGVQWLGEMGPSDDFYRNFFITQVLHQWGGDTRHNWNAALRDHLSSSQAQEGHAAGSWFVEGQHNGLGGRLYCTALATMTLEVYHRHLRVFERDDDRRGDEGALTGVGGVAGPLGDARAAGKKAKKTSKPPGPKQTMPLRVVDEQGKPLAGAGVVLIAGRRKTQHTPDASGSVSFDVPVDRRFSISVHAKGRVTMVRAWDPRMKFPKKSRETVTLPRPTSIGGVVHGDQDRPVEGAVVMIGSNWDSYKDLGFRPHFRFHVKTDSEGRWRFDGMPDECLDTANAHVIRLYHPHYISSMERPYDPEPSSESLRGLTSVMTLKQGLAVEGTVTDRDGQPIAGAWVGQGTDRCRPYTVETRTDEQGHYRFTNGRPGRLTLTAVAPGHAPELREVTVTKRMKPTDFRLAPGKTMRLRVVDVAGQPIPGAHVVPDRWRGRRTLHFMGISKKVDAQGRWVWNGAPEDEVRYDVYQRGYMSCRKRSLVASDEEQTVVLHPELVISGRVTDERTGRPIPTFRVVRGHESDTPKPGTRSWDPGYTATTGKNGRYQIAIGEPANRRLIHIDAPGYARAVSRVIGNDEGNVTLDFRLAPVAKTRRSDAALDIGELRVTPANKAADAEELLKIKRALEWKKDVARAASARRELVKVLKIDERTTDKRLVDRVPALADVLTRAESAAFNSGTITVERLLAGLRLARDLKIATAELAGDQAARRAAMEEYRGQTYGLVKRLRALAREGARGGEQVNVTWAEYCHAAAAADLAQLSGDRAEELGGRTEAVKQAEKLVKANRASLQVGTVTLQSMVEALKCRREAKMHLAQLAKEEYAQTAMAEAVAEYHRDISALRKKVEALHETGAHGGEEAGYHTLLAEEAIPIIINTGGVEPLARRALDLAKRRAKAVHTAYDTGTAPLSRIYPCFDNLQQAQAWLADAAEGKQVKPLRGRYEDPIDGRLHLVKRIAALNHEGARGGELCDYAHAAGQYAMARLRAMVAKAKEPRHPRSTASRSKPTADPIAARDRARQNTYRLKQRMVKQFAELLAKRDYEALAAMFSPELKEVLPASKLRTIVKELEARYGAISVGRSGKTRRWGDERLWLVELDMPRAELGFRLALDDEGRIVGLWIGRQQSHHPTEDFSESRYQFGGAIERVAKAGLQIHVHVVDPDGQPVTASSLSLWMEVPKGAKPSGEASSWTDPATGRVWQLIAGGYHESAVDRLLPGVYRAEAYSRIKSPDRNYTLCTPCGMSEEIRIDAADSTSDLTVHLRKGPSLTLRVRNKATGKPLEEDYAFLKNLDNGFCPGHTYHLARSDGEYTADDLPPGTYRLYAGRSARRPEDLQYRPIDEPMTITVAKSATNEFDVELVGKPLDKEALEARWPWVATGTVTDEKGQPMEGVEIWAHCGMGSLFRTGITTTDKAGRYTLRFAPGIYTYSQDGRPPLNAQCAIISPHKDGYIEKDLYRHGRRTAVSRLPEKDEWAAGSDTEHYIIPGRPARLDFVMVRAASLKGRLVDEHGKPIGDCRLSLRGKEMAPGVSVMGSATSDAEGRFQIDRVPPGHAFWLAIGSRSGGREEIRTQSIRLAKAGTHGLELRHRQIEDTNFEMLEIVKVTGPDGSDVTGTVVGDDPFARPPVGPELQEKGQEILEAMAEVNRYWLTAPPSRVSRYEYDFVLTGAEPHRVKVDNPRSGDTWRRQGISWYSAIHHLATYPEDAVFRQVEVGEDEITLVYRLVEPVSISAGNGLVGTWSGFSSGSMREGKLVLDRRKLTPLKHIVDGKTREAMSDYVDIGEGAYVPQTINIDANGRWLWKFGVHGHGLWLFRSSHRIDGKREELAQVENVKVNGKPAAQRKFGELTLRVVDMASGRGMAGVKFGKSNTGAEAWGGVIGVSDAEGYFRATVPADQSFPWYYSVWKLPKGYKVAGREEVKLEIITGERIEHTFFLRRETIAPPNRLGPLSPQELARVPQPKPQANHAHFASTVTDMPGLEGKKVKFEFNFPFRAEEKQVTAAQRQLAAEIFHHGRFVAKAVRSEVIHFRKAEPLEPGNIDKMDRIVITVGPPKKDRPRRWSFECRLPDGFLHKGCRVRFKDFETWDLQVPDYLQ